MNTFRHILLIAALAISIPTEARVFKSVTAADVAVADVELAWFTQYEWRAEVTAGNPEVVLHVVQGGKELTRSSSSGQSSVTAGAFIFAGGPATLIVRAVSGAGQIRLLQQKAFRRPIRLLSGTPVNAAAIDVTSINGFGEFIETAHAPGGIADPALIGLDDTGANGSIVAFDRDSGIGNNAVISHLAIKEVILFRQGPVGVCIFGQPCPGPGVGNVYVNDRYSDTDGDGLGDELEFGLNTCPGHPVGACLTYPGSNDLVANAADTDSDGLSDYAEVLGVDDPDDPQYLSRWGADPRHKDVFVEVDRRITGDPAAIDPANTFTDDDLGYIVSSFLLGSSASDLQNPDGYAGINIHIDVGIDPSAQQLNTIPGALTLFGDWGGSTSVPDDVSMVDSGQHFMAPVRQTLFRHALLVEGESSTGKAVGKYFFWNGKVEHFVHELGHTLGIDHHGAPGLSNVNCKPHYVSVMNYRYGWIPGPSTFDSSRFSDGSRKLALNPARVLEPDGIGVLDGRFYDDGETELDVDWDLSGDISGRYVRAPLTFRSSGLCGTSWKNPQSLLQAMELPAATPALARSGNVLYAFWVGKDSRVSYRRAAIGDADAKGSCPLNDEFETECAAWTSPRQLPGVATATSVDAVALEGKVHVLTSANDGTLSIASFNAGSGQLAAPQTLKLGERAVGEPEIAGIYFRQPNVEGGIGIAVWYRDESLDLRQFVLRDSGSLAVVLGPQLAEIDFPPGFAPSTAPSVEAWPDVVNPVASTGRNCMALPGPESVEMFCDTLGDNRYLHRQSLSIRGLEARPGLEFRVHRKDDGTPLDGLGRKGNFWLAYVKPGDDPGPTRIAVSQPFDGGNDLTFFAPGEDDIAWDFNFGGRQRVLPRTGIMLYMDDDTSAMKAIAAQGPGGLTTVNSIGQVDVADAHSSITFLPFADGTYRVYMRDSNDWETMADHMCRRLRDDGFCPAN